MSLLQQEPGHARGVHAAADHGDQVRGKDQPHSAMLDRHLRAVSIIAISAAAFAAASSMREVVKPFSVYHDGDDLIFTPESAGTHRLASVGPWNLGERVAEDKPIDKRLNLYFVAPG